MDYNIKFSYKGMGKAASNVRSKVIQSQKSASKRAGTAGGTGDRATVSAIKALNSSITKLIKSNKDLANAMRGQRPGSSSSSMPSGGGRGGISSGGIASLGMTGFVVQKINQVGNAFIQKAGEQKGSVGVGGFRTGQGMYGASEMGAGMKAYGMKTGTFGTQTARTGTTKKGRAIWGQKNIVSPEKSALDIGGIFGLSAQETLGQAGTFKRSGASYGGAADVAFGAGIQTEIPTLLSGMAGLMEDAIKNGINTSDMSKDLGKEITALTMKTQTKSVDAAMGIVRSFSSTQKAVGEGQLGGITGVYTARAGRSMLMDKLTGKGKDEYLENLYNSGMISEEHYAKMGNLGDKSTFQDLQKMVGTNVAFGLEERSVRQAGPAKMATASLKQMIKGQGYSSVEDMYKKSRYMAKDFGGMEGFFTAYRTEMDGGLDSGLATSGKGMRKKRIKGVEGGTSGWSVKQQRARENLLLKRGASFAVASLKMENAMLDIADKGAKPAIEALKLLSSAIGGTVTFITNASNKIDKATDKISGFFKSVDKSLMGIE